MTQKAKIFFRSIQWAGLGCIATAAALAFVCIPVAALFLYSGYTLLIMKASALVRSKAAFVSSILCLATLIIFSYSLIIDIEDAGIVYRSMGIYMAIETAVIAVGGIKRLIVSAKA